MSNNLPVPTQQQQQDDELPVTQDENFCGEFHDMDLSKLKDLTFIVGVSSGDRNKCKVLSSTIHGPYSFYEMVEEVGRTWKDHQHHVKPIILDKNSKKTPKFLDQGTVDYIEAHYFDIITSGMLGGDFDEDKQFTCVAGITEADNYDDPTRTPTEDVSVTTK